MGVGEVGYLTRCFFAPRLKMSTSALLRGIIGRGAPGAGLEVREVGAELMRGGIDPVGALGFEMIEEMRPDGLVAGRAAVSGGDAEAACGRCLAAAWGGREVEAALLERCRGGAGFEERGGEENEAWGRDEGRSSNRSSASSKSSSSSSEDPTNVSAKPPSFFAGDVKARNRASLSSNDGPLIPVIPPENFATGLCFLDNILTAGWLAC